MRKLLLGLAVFSALTTPAKAEPCLTLAEITPSLDARFLAGSVRGCIAEARYSDAIRMFFAYSNFSLFDQQRVWDESSHVAVQELHLWIFSGYSQDQMSALKAEIDRLRRPQSPSLLDTCAAVARLGPPSYRPDYMIKRGQIPRRTDTDWRTEGFDPDAAWKKALVDINKCPQAVLQ